MSFFDKHEYKDYRNPKFEKFVNGFGVLLSCAMLVVTTHALSVAFGRLIAAALMFVYFLVSHMRTQTIYYYSNKDLGPSWRETFMEDLAHAFRDTCACVGFCLLVKWITSHVI